ncbi:nose resistant to fluoxetine protein 6-like isoform X2 [Anticarsia gemmatalis]|uniref:nose resistant to fluoxetine protein 6-like isoform X2 n=1 Tax=Anticarsia gemmatalis TaxID=129554 RepID=UPI003F7723A5
MIRLYLLCFTCVWDANKLPSGGLYGSVPQFGNFDQCMEPPWLETHPQFTNQYCIARVKMADKNWRRKSDPFDSTNLFLNTKTRSGISVNQFQWGVCVPAVCPPQAVVKIIRQMFLLTHLKATSNVNITIQNCQTAGVKNERSTGFYLFMVLMVTLFTITVAATYFRKHYNNEPRHYVVGAILKSFCMVNNSSELIKSGRNDIIVLSGVRFITAANIVVIHLLFYIVISGIGNGRYLDQLEYLGMLMNYTIVVDTFFVMSGLLHIKGLLEKRQNLLMVLWKRYIRVIGLFALAILYLSSVATHAGSGPIWRLFYDRESALCQNNWLQSLFMINTSLKTNCHVVTWYLACDYQLTVFGTILFYLYKRNRRLGVIAFVMATILSLLISAIVTYRHELPPVEMIDLENVLKLREDDLFDYTYTSTYSRGAPYFTGAALGYLMHLYKPSDYRKTLSKLFSTIGTIFSLILMLGLLYAGCFFVDRPFNGMEAVLGIVSFRALWGLAVCCVIGCCEYGDVPCVTDFLSVPVFTPLGKLSYALFIVHCFVINPTSRSIGTRSPLVFDFFTIIVDSVGTIAVSLAIGYILHLLVEAPLINLSNEFICERFRSAQPGLEKKNGIEHRNGKTKAS